MIRKLIYCFLSLFAFCFSTSKTYAQKTETIAKYYAIDTITTNQIETNVIFNERNSGEILISFLKNKSEKISFKKTAVTESKTAKHYLYQLVYNNIEIYNSQIKLSVLKNGKINSLFLNEYPLPVTQFFIDSNEVKKHLPKTSDLQQYSITPAYFFDGEKTIGTQKINYLSKDWLNMELIINSDNRIIYKRDLNSYFTSPTDSLVQAKVFMPDPLSSAQQNYGAPYNDQNDDDINELNNQQMQVDMRVTFNNDTFWLYNDFVRITRFSTPDIEPVAVTTLSTFNYTRNQSQFEDVNVYYHLNQYNKYLKNLGFTNLVNYQIWVDTHALNGQDNSMFSPTNTPPRLFFGEGGVDDAEDADVIVHEYGHAISHSAAPNTNNGTERKTLEEANCDYFAASYSKSITNYNWENVYSWDGHNEYWNGRMASTTKLYNDLTFVSIYSNTDIWSGTLMEIESIIGRNVLQEIVLESIHSYATDMSMPQAAWLLVKADSALNNGGNYSVICPIIKEKQFTNTCPVIDGISKIHNQNKTPYISNSEGFSKGDCLQINNCTGNSKISIYNTNGLEIYTNEFKTNNYTLCSDNFDKGIYFLKISSNNYLHSFKLIRF